MSFKSFLDKLMTEEKKYDVVIIGGATAGMTAAIYTARKKLKTVILTKETGGQNLKTDRIDNFPGFLTIAGKDLTSKIKEQVDKYEVPVVEGVEVEKIDIHHERRDEFTIHLKNGDVYESRTVIISTGKNPRLLGIPGEKEFENKGVSFCPTCDAPLFGGKDVAVIGSGNSGLESANDLLKYANKIYVLEYGVNIKGDPATVEALKKTGKVEFILRAETKEIQGGNFVEKLIYRDLTDNDTNEIKVEGVFVNIGWVPATNFLNGFVKLNNYGEVEIDHKTTQASVPGVYAAGDVSDTLYKQCVIAAGEGAKAALSAYNYILEKDKGK